MMAATRQVLGTRHGQNPGWLDADNQDESRRGNARRICNHANKRSTFP